MFWASVETSKWDTALLALPVLWPRPSVPWDDNELAILGGSHTWQLSTHLSVAIVLSFLPQDSLVCILYQAMLGKQNITTAFVQYRLVRISQQWNGSINQKFGQELRTYGRKCSIFHNNNHIWWLFKILIELCFNLLEGKHAFLTGMFTLNKHIAVYWIYKCPLQHFLFMFNLL